MNKEEILEKARNHKKNEMDEREKSINLTGNNIAFASTMILCVILMLMKMDVDQSYYDVYSLIGIALASKYIYVGIKTQKKLDFLLGLGWLSLSIVMVYSYYCSLL